jgi:predicted PurR-regulated permease PerM
LATVLEMPSLGPETSAMATTRSLPPMSHYAKATLTVVAVLVALATAWAVRSVLLLVLVAAVLAVGLDPPARRLERVGLSRAWSVVLIALLAVGLLVLFSWLVTPPLVKEIRELAANIPDYIRRLQSENGAFADLERKYHVSERLTEVTSKLPSLASASFGTVLGFTKSIASFIFNTLTVTILTIYFLLALPRMQAFGERMLTGRNRTRDVAILQESLQRIGGYVSGNIGISIIAGIFAYIFLRLIGVPFAAALAMWVAITDLIPSVGAILGAVVVAIVAAFSGVGDLIATIVYFIVYQQVENYVIAPRVMAKAIDLSPAAVIVSVLIGGSLGGFAGVLLALPLAAAAKVVVRELWVRDRMEPQAEASGGS